MIAARFFTLVSVAGQDFVWNFWTVESTFEEPEAFFPWSKDALATVWTKGSALAILLVVVGFLSRFSVEHLTPSNALAPLSLVLGSGPTIRHSDEDREEAEEEHPCPVEVCPFLLREYFFLQFARDCRFPSTCDEPRPLPWFATIPAGSTE